MNNSKSHGRLLILFLGCAAIAGLAAFWWLCERSPKIAFLPERGSAQWIVYPKPPDGLVFQTMEMSTEFHRSFNLQKAPAKAVMVMRALKKSAVTINGVAFNETPGPQANWKLPVEFDITKQLRAGTNEVMIKVYNSNGPPALWLSLDAGDVKVETDREWEASLVGAAWRPARLATLPMEIDPGNGLYGGENSLTAILQHLPSLICFAVLSGLIVFLGNRWFKQYKQVDSGRFALLAVAIIAIAWCAMFFNNIRLLPNTAGFDVAAHEDYIDYIKIHHALPLATDGWEMCQAPLYYMVSAAVVSPFHSGAVGDAGIRCLRILGMVVGIAQAVLILLSLRVLFPGQTGKQFFGLLIAAFIPEQIYLAQYISNESMAAAWVTAAIYFCLRLISQDRDSWKLSLATGLCLGAALLTKVTAVLVIPFIGGAVLGWLWLKQPRKAGPWLHTLGTMMLAAFAVSGWHYLRVWKHFGSPVVNDWDPASGFAWWTDEGFHFAAYFARFGQCLIHPFYSGFHGFTDGIYSTMWGDSLYGGMAALHARPPWNFGLMAAGCLLAIVPTAIILTGLVSCVRKFIRQPEPAWFLLIGLPFTTLAALAYMNLKLPFYCNVKAFYGMMALLPVCAFGAVGWDILTRKRRTFRFVMSVMCGVWALTAYASFWIQDGAATTHVVRGMGLAGENGRSEDAIKEFNEALRIDPQNVDAKTSLAVKLFERGQVDESVRMLGKALDEHPADANGHLQLASILAAQNQMEPAIQHAERAIALEPDFATPYHHLSAWFSQLGRNREALIAGREGLRLKPTDPELHFLVACALASFTNHVEAVAHFQLACKLRPDWVAPYERLGSSLAALGHWKQAMSAATKALELAQAGKDAETSARIQKLLEFCREKPSVSQPGPGASAAHP